MFQVLQMVQFVLVMVHAFQLLIINDCDYPIYFAYFIGAHAVLFYFLFSRFYKQAYTKQKVSGRSQIKWCLNKKNQIKYAKIIYGQRLIKLCFFCWFQKVEPAAAVANGKKNDDAAAIAATATAAIDDSKHDSMKFLNGQTNIYKNKIDTTRSRRSNVGSAN